MRIRPKIAFIRIVFVRYHSDHAEEIATGAATGSKICSGGFRTSRSGTFTESQSFAPGLPKADRLLPAQSLSLVKKWGVLSKVDISHLENY